MTAAGMTDPQFSLGVSACVMAGLSFIAVGVSWAVGRRWRGELQSESVTLQQFVDDCRVNCEEQAARLARDIESMRSALKPSGEVPGNGAFNLSVRAQALQLLRTGMSPETAATTLGLPCRDVRLLAKVSRVLATPSIQ